MSALESKEYGLVDEVFAQRTPLPGGKQVRRARFIDRGRPEARRSRAPLLLLLRQEPEGGEEAHRRAHGLHLRRVHRPVQRHHRRGDREGDPRASASPRCPSRRRSRPSSTTTSSARSGPRRSSSVAIHNHYKRIDAKVGADEVELHKSNILLLGPDRLGQDAAGPDAGQDPQRPVRHRRRHQPDRGGLRRRGRREHHRQPAAERRPRHREGRARASSTSTRSTRSPARAKTRRSPATSRARACSRRC